MRSNNLVIRGNGVEWHISTRRSLPTRKINMSRRFVLSAFVLLLAFSALALTSVGYSYFAASGKASQKFKVGDAGKIEMSIDKIDEKLIPGTSAPVNVELQNVGEWVVKVQKIALNSVTDLPDNCPQSAFGFKPLQINKTLTADEKLSLESELKMDNNAPNACAGAEPLLTLEVS